MIYQNVTPNLSSQALLNLTHCNPRESISTPRYSWHNAKRGETDFVIIQWTLSGEGRYEDAKGIHAVPADHAFIALVPGESRYFYPQEGREPWIFGWLNFYGGLGYRLFETFQAEFGPVVPLASRGAAMVALKRLLAMWGRRRQSNRWQISGLAYVFFLEWCHEAGKSPDTAAAGLERAIRFCREHFREPCGIKEIAAEAGMSREHFSRLFSAQFKETPAAHLRHLRLTEAAKLLRETRLPLEEIALRSGFYSARHILRTFQRDFGENPSAYRARMERR